LPPPAQVLLHQLAAVHRNAIGTARFIRHAQPLHQAGAMRMEKVVSRILLAQRNLPLLVS
jgi:hypothetical protein